MDTNRSLFPLFDPPSEKKKIGEQPKILREIPHGKMGAANCTFCVEWLSCPGDFFGWEIMKKRFEDCRGEKGVWWCEGEPSKRRTKQWRRRKKRQVTNV